MVTEIDAEVSIKRLVLRRLRSRVETTSSMM
jgi:hypothetical protein